MGEKITKQQFYLQFCRYIRSEDEYEANTFFSHTDSIEPDGGAYLQTSSYPVLYYSLQKSIFFSVEEIK